jgi:hypothetical protein
MINIRCQICNEPIAQANTLHLHRPMVGAMFLSPDPFHGFDPPFAPNTDWLGMLCPYCRHRPFITEDEVLTDTGIYRVPGPMITEDEVPPLEPESPTWLECEVCGKSIKGAGPMASHMRVHK